MKLKSDNYLETIDEGEMVDETLLFIADAEILFFRSGNVSITKSRNSNNSTTSFCNSCKVEKFYGNLVETHKTDLKFLMTKIFCNSV